ncbi:MAG: outer membrane lipoprotein-sorting protein [Myxococcaceae bacterium]|nr:outer membrane lipoprotein-sorting protein [Myxococcaceae bacterium]MCI0673088.1 outer membrane lipoprotein-sorting protein [Myxococcaceae bacterium]
MKTQLKLLSLLLLLPAAALAAPPSAEELLKKYDAIMGPTNFEGAMTMVAHRDDGSTRSYKMRMLKAGDEKARIWFDEPAAARGQEILRQGDNAWIYMPNLKRAVRMANRDSFQGGDFNNADVLRTNYGKDYAAQVVEDPAMPEAYLLELKAKTEDASYDRIKLWVARKDAMPIKGEYYTASGKLLRAAEFVDVKSFKGVKRPARVVMKNMIATKRFSELTVDSMDVRVQPAAGRFVLDDLGR